ncbi:HAMP domain-containing histidine kinase [Ruminococcaceae bacterium OttesenSCG-928-A11]|nr:HAMP domain-containing histidine kinase [Ruminococcaceae bacterium OttesenSCG-928-A11]
METPNPVMELPGPPTKERKWPARLISLLLVAGLAAGVMALSLDGYNGALQKRPPLYQQTDFLARLPQFGYLLNWRLEQEARANYTLTPAQLYYPALYTGENRPTGTAGDDSRAIDNDIDSSLIFPEDDTPGDDSTDPDNSILDDADDQNPIAFTVTDDDELAEFLDDYMQTVFMGYDVSFSSTWEGMEYLAYSGDSGLAYGHAEGPVAALAQGTANADDLAALEYHYDFYIALHFGPNGELSPTAYNGVSRDDLVALEQSDIHREFSERIQANGYGEEAVRQLEQLFRPASNLTVVFAIPADAEASIEQRRYDIWTMEAGGFYLFLWGGLALAALLGLALATVRPLGLNRLASCSQPLELSALFIVIPLIFSMESLLAEWLVRAQNNTLLLGYLPDSFDPELVSLINYGVCGLLLAALYGLVYTAAASLMQLRGLGLRRYFAEKCLVVRGCRAIGRGFRRLWGWLSAIDLTEKGNKAIIKILAVNFVILALLCTVWVFGIALLVVYTIVLFILMRRYYTDLKRKYAILLEATGKMAEGELDVPIEEDLGVFEPVKQELKRVQHGFAHAVEAETRSQNMKTELITNVSHDLKTPLTAIITYVDLLKKEDLTDEERREYVATLDRKSQRLKRLIEDLFEMSRAASRDLNLNLQMVDLPALIRQVELEAGDELAAAGIEFRYQFPDEKVELPLDSEKTSRIFENLVLNVAKYGMPGSRAYAALRREDGAVVVEVKNVSRDELNFEGKDITDRFVRGDASRSTEGSGLGLAIAKSFVEAQGGTFTIQTDGDLFKACVRFPVQP